MCFNDWNEYNGNVPITGKNTMKAITRSRSRRCKEFPYFNGTHSGKHPDPNQWCENHIQSQSERGCFHKTFAFCKYNVYKKCLKEKYVE